MCVCPPSHAHAYCLASQHSTCLVPHTRLQEREMAGLKQLSNQLMDRVTRASNGARIMWPPEANAEPLVVCLHGPLSAPAS